MAQNLISQKECREIQLRIMKEIDRICTKHQLQYYIAYGSLLGAVRHHGFIPWDDDIDVIMPRADYQRLLGVIRQHPEEAADWISLLDSAQKDYYYPFAKLVDNRTVAKMEDNLTEHGIWIDVFPIDGLPDNPWLCKIHIALCLLLRAMVISMTTDFSASHLGKSATLKRLLRGVAGLIGRKRVSRLEDRVMPLYTRKNNRYVGCLFSPYGQREKVEASELFQPTRLTFEGEQFCAPYHWDAFLSRIYGDYMQLPPPEKRRTHRIEAWYK